MRVIITGGAGLIGRATAAHLAAAGWDVHTLDIAEATGADWSHAVCDMLDFEGLLAQVRGADAVVHLAALRAPYLAPGQDVFRINMSGTFNIFEAAAKSGIKRVVQASSINAIGCAWNLGDFNPRYLPVDEDHPPYITDVYSLTKQQGEEVGAYYWRREGISSIGLRFPGVYPEFPAPPPEIEENLRATQQFLDSFVSLPAAEQARRLAEVREAALRFRATRPLEYPNKDINTDPPPGIEAGLWEAYTFDRYNLWAWIDIRDAALSIERSLTAEFEGAHPLFVADDHNFAFYDAATLARLFFPDVPDRGLSGDQPLVSTARARDLIGFQPQFSIKRGDA